MALICTPALFIRGRNDLPPIVIIAPKGFEEQVKFLRLKDIKWDQSIVDEVVKKCEELSRCITGHSHSDVYASVKPTSAKLLKEIEEFEALKKRYKALVKA